MQEGLGHKKMRIEDNRLDEKREKIEIVDNGNGDRSRSNRVMR